jgi:hypothetical protein
MENKSRLGATGGERRVRYFAFFFYVALFALDLNVFFAARSRRRRRRPHRRLIKITERARMDESAGIFREVALKSLTRIKTFLRAENEKSFFYRLSSQNTVPLLPSFLPSFPPPTPSGIVVTLPLSFNIVADNKLSGG